MPQPPLPLPTNRVFVVQLRTQPLGAPLAWDECVEHGGPESRGRIATCCAMLCLMTAVVVRRGFCGRGRAATIYRKGSTARRASPRTVHPMRKEKAMIRRAALFACVPLLLHVGLASAQESFPIMEKVAQKVIEKYQTSSCQQLAQQKSQPPTGQKAQVEQRAVQMLRNDPQMRTEFLSRVAAPIANKLFECGLIP